MSQFTTETVVCSGFTEKAGTGKILPALPEALKLAPEQTALIVIDMQNAYTSMGGYLDLAGFDVSKTKPVVENIKKAVAAAHEAGIQVIYFKNGWDDQYREAGGVDSPNFHKSNALKTMRKKPELQGTLLAKGHWDFELIDELQLLEQDLVIEKPRYSGFFNTALDSMLRCRGIRNLVFVGIATNVCVESTLRDGFFLEYFGVALDDACYQAGPVEAHEASLFNIKTFFGWVSDTKNFVETFKPQLQLEKSA
ncbi:peroxyureidoacrylate/ureidoacrylate amidohydrolase RutB [Acinetobacter bouvetii DSM 14964 = CIP 107468]|uniref:Ureidoacrylate amidohydrolase RutB n=1 Tax=Acinetobacter bouvetii DSM 14964 = CIP 107468 TaxID=1120925 RepID=N9CBW1_9GAMM|nr:pyrimidine utilization protein B [Acinetobacter bouvetii]ENV83317.1 peroxyureidoacrylate/ureidoacrylate amidohydrolase RutB [Acinetobacter bouvetii DSM 14964 = CIP 107468]BCU65252.1 peroxyureidoacrylate/ureidoacrylate amidohydrolase RutB [Acinetobacter bouvetii]